MIHTRAAFIILLALVINQFYVPDVHACRPNGADPARNDLVFITPAEGTQENLPVMELLPDTTDLYQKLLDDFNNSYLSQAVHLYALAVQYASCLDTSGSIPPHPAYLAITQNEGGFARKGFFLRNGDSLVNHSTTPYIDITERAASGDLAGLMSLTQLYPHELGHVLYHLFSREDSADYNNRSVDMHYFSVITDFPTAFNEGFAEHMENISRLREQNDSISSGIEEDIDRINNLVEFTKKKFERDLRFSFRIGFYKATMVNWFQKYEDYKRYRHALDGTIRFKSTTPGFYRPADRITFRNTMVSWDTGRVRNKVQAHATEGMISAFFTRLTLGDLGLSYREPAFYAGCSEMCMDRHVGPETWLSPVENMFLKYFHVFHHSIVSNNSETSQLIDFIQGYVSAFPDEADEILEVYSEVFGAPYSPDLPPPLWLLNESYTHRLLTLDAYGAITIPAYTFDLNAAETEDLLTLEGMSEEDAATIISFRDQHGFYESISQVASVPGIGPEAAEILHDNAFSKALFEEKMNQYEAGINMGSLISKPLINIGLKVLLYVCFFYTLWHVFVIKEGRQKLHRYIVRFMGHCALWMSVMLAATFAVLAFQNPVPVILAFQGLLLLSSYLIYMKNPQKRKFSLLMQCSLLLVLVISVV